MKDILIEKKAKLTQALQQLVKQQQYVDAQIMAHKGALELIDQLLQEVEKERQEYKANEA